MGHSSSPPIGAAGTNDRSGARFRVIAAATSERSRGASARSALSASATVRSAGTTTCTSRCPQSGAGETSSTKRSLRPSSACRSARARFSARCTCRQNCRALRSACLPDDKRSDVFPPKAWANSGSTKSADPFGRRLRCFKTKLPCARARAPGPYADTYVVAVNLFVVECDGSRPGRPDCLRGGEQARRHRAACNRGHGLLRCCVEFEVALVDWRPAQALLREIEAHATGARSQIRNERRRCAVIPELG